jgi:hypothetical protein
MRSLHRLTSFVALLSSLSFVGRAHAQEPPAPPPADEPSSDDEVLPEEEADEVAPEEAPPAEAAPEEDAAAGEEDEIDDEALMEGDGEDPSRPPPAGKGAVWGVITDTEFNETLIEAPVQVIGTKIETLTDEQGRFRLELAPGTYSLRITYELHKSARIDGVVVAPGQVIRLDSKLQPDETATDVFEVVEEADKTSLEGMILARQKATVVGDSVGRAEITKSADKNAAQAAQRVVGATIVGGRFVYVRGLGERYTNALINGVPLPSPEPDRAAVPLDLFPTGVLNSLTIAKTFTPDVPGDFAGGSVRIDTREIPAQPLFQLGAGIGYNTNTTFRERLTHRGGDLDWLGFDDGTRAFPEGIPDDYAIAVNAPKPNGEMVSEEEANEVGQKINSYMSATRSNTLPNHSVSAVGGNGWDLGNDRKVGVLASVNYGRSYTVRRNELIRDYEGDSSDPRGFSEERNYLATTGNENVNWGGFGSLTYQFSAQHRLSLVGLRSTLADNRTQHVKGWNELRSADIWATRLTFVTRALNLGLLSGEHRFPGLNSAELDWNVTLSNATRYEPDRRDTVWSRGTTTAPYQFTDATDSGRHFFSDQDERQYGGGLDWTQPIGGLDTKVKTGALVSLRDRNFEARILRFRQRRGTRDVPAPEPDDCPSDVDACNDALFLPDRIGTTLQIDESTGKADAYDAFLNIYSAYVMADVGITDKLRAVIGERIEHTFQVIDPYNQFELGSELERARIRQTDLLPAVAAIWSPTKKAKFRASVTKTLARPQLLELAPFTYQDYFGGRLKGGYKDLKMTSIINADLRVEYFPTLRDVLALSFFFKSFKDPIEPVILGDSLTYRNAEGATLLGIELEARRDLEPIAAALKGFSVVSNLTLARSRIEVTPTGTLALTNLSRPLVNQAPWVFNIALDYSLEKTGTTARLLYNIVGPRIVEVGAGGLDDVYEHPRNMLDLTVQQDIVEDLKVKLEAKNLLNSQIYMTQGCSKSGVFGSTWHIRCTNGDDYATSRYTEGVSFNVSGSYDF